MPGSIRIVIAVLLTGIGLGLGGCAAPSPPRVPVALPPVPAAELLQRVVASGGEIDTLRSLAKVRLTTGDRNLGVSQVLLASYPDRLRSETLSPFGSPLLILASDGRRLEVLIPGEARFLEGPASADNLRRFTRLPLRLPDLVGLLLYRPPRLPWEAERVSTEGGSYRLFLDGPGKRRQVFSFDPTLQLTGAAYYDGDTLLLEVSYGEFGEASPRFPHNAELRLPAYDVAAAITLKDVTLNADIPAERFQLQPPPGSKIEELPGDK